VDAPAIIATAASATILKEKGSDEMAESYWSCPRCGMKFDRSNQWEMQLVDSHLDRHDSEKGNNRE
jgi:uncharacterized C2H2 Zn-finger protein